MGLLSRRKGRAFEQHIARKFRERWPDAVVRRASQADRAHQSDVYVIGGPTVLQRLWLECQDSRSPTPLSKLEQAESDATKAQCAAWPGMPPCPRLPIAVWHRTGTRSVDVTMRMWALDAIRGVPTKAKSHAVVTLSLDDLLGILSEAA